MSATTIENVKPGHIVRAAVVGPNGTVLVRPGAVLTGCLIERLKRQNIDTLVVETGEESSEETRSKLLEALDRRFEGHEADPLMTELKNLIANEIRKERADARA